ncbi:MAG: hypothetical protein O3C05_00425 [Proteobacteria bacterium]|nr:hypothetical protein [Pseudomonadota bacterium]
MGVNFKGIKDKLPKFIQVRQKMMGVLIIGSIVLLATGIIFFTEEEDKKNKLDSAKKQINISQPIRKVKAEDVWVEKAQMQIEQLIKKVEMVTKENEQLKQKVSNYEGIEERIKKIEEKASLETKVKQSEDNPKEVDESTVVNQAKEDEEKNIKQEESMKEEKKIVSINIDLEGGFNKKQHSKELEVYLPSGSYVGAELISGVDASVGVESQGDPRPVLFRITARAVNALYKGEPQKVDLEGCIVTGAAIGDISSERVFVRLLKMSCSREKEKAFENEVEGYASSRGKAGIRGVVVSREGDFVSKSFIAGLFSGLGGGISQRYTSPEISFNTGGGSSNVGNKMGYKDIFGKGFGKGAEVAGNKVSDYLIKRAEQYQPVVSVNAGQEVELVFNNGVYLDGRVSKQQNN